MDTEWAIARLEAWIALASRARVSGPIGSTDAKYEWAYATSEQIAELRVHHDQVRRIVHRTLGYKQLPDLLYRAPGSKTINLMSGIVMCQESIGRLRTVEETTSKLGPQGPSLVADQLHKDVWHAASRRWEAGNYSDAVQRAATFLNASIQDDVGRYDVSDSELMREAFSMSPPAPGKSRLMWPGEDSRLSVRAMRVGMLNYSQGLFSAVRNTATHSTEEMTQQEALEQLATLSVLARWVDQCERVDFNADSTQAANTSETRKT